MRREVSLKAMVCTNRQLFLEDLNDLLSDTLADWPNWGQQRPFSQFQQLVQRRFNFRIERQDKRVVSCTNKPLLASIRNQS